MTGVQTCALPISSLPGTDAGGHPSPDTTLDGLSEDVVNFVEYYEKNGYSFRIGQRYRSGFSALRHNAFRFVMDTIRPEMVVDVQAGYTFQTGRFQNLEILFEVNNLFDEPYVVTQTVGGSTELKEHHEFGTQYLLGMNYKL